MMQLITPPGMLLTVALLAIYCACALVVGWIENSWLLMASGCVCMVAAYGTAMLRPWSEYLVYALTTGFIAKLLASVTYAMQAGFFEFQFATRAQAVWSLAPSMVIVVLSLTCCFFVARHFARRQQTGPEISGHGGSPDPK